MTVGPTVHPNSINECISQELGKVIITVTVGGIVLAVAVMLYILIAAIIGIAITNFSTLFGNYHAWIYCNYHIKTNDQLKNLRFLDLINMKEISNGLVTSTFLEIS